MSRNSEGSLGCHLLLAVFLALALCSLSAVTAEARNRPLEQGSFTAELNGFKIHYEVRGSGPVLMTVPNSWGLTHEGLRGLYRPLEQHFTLVYFDPRGMGRSSPASKESDRGLAAVREDFDALRRHLKLDKVVALGWSNGAVNLMYLASERPETLAGAIFLHAPSRFGEEDAKAMEISHPFLVKKYMAFMGEMASAKLPAPQADARLKRFYTDEYFPALCADPKACAEMFKGLYAAAGFSWAHTVYAEKELPTYDARERLRSARVPSLVVAGSHDLLPAERVREVAAAIPGAQFALFERSGHFSPVEEPGAFQDAVLDFIPLCQEPGRTLMEMERAALERWGKGDPSGFLEICDPEVRYFDPHVERRIDGLEALARYYEQARGKIRIDRFELLNPKIQLLGKGAVLSYNYVSWTGGKESRWNCTEVYRRTPQGWRIIQSHWSKTAVGQKAS